MKKRILLFILVLLTAVVLPAAAASAAASIFEITFYYVGSDGYETKIEDFTCQTDASHKLESLPESLPSDVFSEYNRVGETFKGWTTVKGGTEPNVSTATSFTGDTKLYAVIGKPEIPHNMEIFVPTPYPGQSSALNLYRKGEEDYVLKYAPQLTIHSGSNTVNQWTYTKADGSQGVLWPATAGTGKETAGPGVFAKNTSYSLTLKVCTADGYCFKSGSSASDPDRTKPEDFTVNGRHPNRIYFSDVVGQGLYFNAPGSFHSTTYNTNDIPFSYWNDGKYHKYVVLYFDNLYCTNQVEFAEKYVSVSTTHLTDGNPEANLTPSDFHFSVSGNDDVTLFGTPYFYKNGSPVNGKLMGHGEEYTVEIYLRSTKMMSSETFFNMPSGFRKTGFSSYSTIDDDRIYKLTVTVTPVCDCTETETTYSGNVCTDAGYETVTCTKCKAVLSNERVSCVGHQWAAKYSSDALTHWQVCSLCGACSEPEAHSYGAERCPTCKVLTQGKITYKDDGTALATVTVDRNHDYALKGALDVTAPEGKALVGWKNPSTNRVYRPGEVIVPTGDMTLTAIWADSYLPVMGVSCDFDVDSFYLYHYDAYLNAYHRCYASEFDIGELNAHADYVLDTDHYSPADATAHYTVSDPQFYIDEGSGYTLLSAEAMNLKTISYAGLRIQYTVTPDEGFTVDEDTVVTYNGATMRKGYGDNYYIDFHPINRVALFSDLGDTDPDFLIDLDSDTFTLPECPPEFYALRPANDTMRFLGWSNTGTGDDSTEVMAPGAAVSIEDEESTFWSAVWGTSYDRVSISFDYNDAPGGQYSEYYSFWPSGWNEDPQVFEAWEIQSTPLTDPDGNKLDWDDDKTACGTTYTLTLQLHLNVDIDDLHMFARDNFEVFINGVSYPYTRSTTSPDFDVFVDFSFTTDDHDYQCVHTPGSCIAEETFVYTCSHCGDSYTDTLGFGAHDYDNHGYCDVCGKQICSIFGTADDTISYLITAQETEALLMISEYREGRFSGIRIIDSPVFGATVDTGIVPVSGSDYVLFLLDKHSYAPLCAKYGL